MDLHWLYPCTGEYMEDAGTDLRSIQEMNDRGELPRGKSENGRREAPADWQEKRTVERENAGETYGATENTGTSTKIRLHLKTGELEIVHERVESEGE